MEINDSDVLNKMKLIKGKIEKLIEQGLIKDAREALDNYGKIIPNDADACSMRAVIEIMENNKNEAESILIKALKEYPFNFDLNYNLGYLYEQKGLYLKALEKYENALFGNEIKEKKSIAMDAINNLEVQYKDEIQSQLNDTAAYKEKVSDNDKLNLHIMYDSQYCDKFIQFVNRKFDSKRHLFIITSDDCSELKYVHVEGIDNIRVLSIPKDINELLRYINISSKIFIHYLFDYFCQIICLYNINRPIYWIVWGGDLYNYIGVNLYDKLTDEYLTLKGYNNNFALVNNPISYLRKSAIRKIDFILTGLENADMDYITLKNNYITCAKRMPFMYPNPVDFFLLEKNTYVREKITLKNRYKHVIFGGNSANPSNNHLEILHMLKTKKSEDFCILMPLSYGADNWYVDYIINEGKKMFGERFLPLTGYLSPKDYYGILRQIDIAIFNHNRQQAVGSIIALLYLGKKVYIKDSITTYSFLKELGLTVFNINELSENDFLKLDNHLDLKNKQVILEQFNDMSILKNLKSCFDMNY